MSTTVVEHKGRGMGIPRLNAGEPVVLQLLTLVW